MPSPMTQYRPILMAWSSPRIIAPGMMMLYENCIATGKYSIEQAGGEQTWTFGARQRSSSRSRTMPVELHIGLLKKVLEMVKRLPLTCRQGTVGSETRFSCSGPRRSSKSVPVLMPTRVWATSEHRNIKARFPHL